MARAADGAVYLKDIDVRGVKVAVYVSTRTGRFQATLSGADNAVIFYGETLGELVRKMAEATKKAHVRVSVRFTEARHQITRDGYQGTTFQYGTATGFHSGTGNVLYTWDDRTTGQWRSHNIPGGVYAGELNTAEQAELTELIHAKYDADWALRGWEADHSWDLLDALQAAVKEAMGDDAGS